MESYLTAVYFGNRISGVLKFHNQYKNLIEDSKGSSNNHQNWKGGYIEHLNQCFKIALFLYGMNYKFEELPFKIESVFIVLYFHDIEKIFKYSENSMQNINKEDWYYKILPEDYGINFSNEELNALKYIHGEGVDYSKEQKIMCPLATFCHMADIASARIFFDSKL